MGGRGASSGIKRPQYFGETEKAVKLKLVVDDYDLETKKERIVFVPRSQLSAEGIPGEWITEQKAQEFYNSPQSKSQYSTTWIDAKGRQYAAGQTAKEKAAAAQRQKAMASGTQSYNALIAEAKALGIKGVRKGLKRKTIQAKIDKYKSQS